MSLWNTDVSPSRAPTASTCEETRGGRSWATAQPSTPPLCGSIDPPPPQGGNQSGPSCVSSTQVDSCGNILPPVWGGGLFFRHCCCFFFLFVFFLNGRNFRKICVFFFQKCLSNDNANTKTTHSVPNSTQIVSVLSLPGQLWYNFSEQPHHQSLQGPVCAVLDHKQYLFCPLQLPTGVLFMQNIFLPPDGAKQDTGVQGSNS